MALKCVDLYEPLISESIYLLQYLQINHLSFLNYNKVSMSTQNRRQINSGVSELDDIIRSKLVQNNDSNRTSISQESFKPPILYHYQNNTFKIGFITFSLEKSTKKSSLVNLLTNLYDEKFINNYHSQQNKKQQSKKIQGQNQRNISLIPKFTELILQMVSFHHYNSVISTDQELYILKNTQYKENRHSESMFKLDMLWRIQFRNLKILNISGQKLTSIQGLSFVYLPNLNQLDIHDNRIHNLNSLAKCSMKQLRILLCNSNPVITSQLINRAHFPLIEKFVIDSYKFVKNLYQELNKTSKTMQNINFVFKVQNLPKLKQFTMNSYQRIFPFTLRRKLKDLNSQLKFQSRGVDQLLIERLHPLSEIVRKNDPRRLRRFITQEIHPILRNMETPNQNNFTNQVRVGLYRQLRRMEQTILVRPFSQQMALKRQIKDQLRPNEVKNQVRPSTSMIEEKKIQNIDSQIYSQYNEVEKKRQLIEKQKFQIEQQKELQMQDYKPSKKWKIKKI